MIQLEHKIKDKKVLFVTTKNIDYIRKVLVNKWVDKTKRVALERKF